MARRTLTLWLALNALAFIFASQVWWQLTINTGDPATSVSGTGFDADKSISAILMFSLAALLFVAFSRGWTAIVISATAAAGTLLLLLTTAANFLHHNIGGITSTVEKHTGIWVDPILGSNEPSLIGGQLQFWAWLTLIVLVALCATQIVFAVKYRTWARLAKPRSDRTKPKQTKGEVDDTISLWDAQRE